MHAAGPIPATVLTISDSCAQGTRQDASGPAVAAVLAAHNFDVREIRIVPDDQPLIEAALREAAGATRLVVTTGGTGITARDVTPEATRAVCDRLVDGLPELMRAAGRAETIFAVLSRGVCGLLGSSLVLNLPGSPRGAVSSLEAVLPVLPHALGLLVDAGTPHPPDTDAAALPQAANAVSSETGSTARSSSENLSRRGIA